MFNNIFRAFKLDRAFYEMVEGDPSYRGESFRVVVIASVILSLIMTSISYGSGNLGAAIGVFIFFAIYLIALFFINSFLIFIVARMFGGRASFAEMWPVLGYVQSILAIIIIPGVVIWYLVMSFVAIRQTFDISNRRTFVVLVAAGILQFIAYLGGTGLLLTLGI